MTDHASSDCDTGGLYKTPAKGQTVDVSEPVMISWDTTCFDTEKVDVYLYGPSAARPDLHKWFDVDYKSGSYNATIKPGWWNYTSPMKLQFTIIPAGTPLFMREGPPGPLITATFSGTDRDETAVVGGVTQADAPVESHGPSKGGIAAAVIIPLLLVIALAVAAYIKISRAKGKEKRKRFSQMVDKRMSTISTDWKSLSGAGANAAIRNSMAVSGNRASSFSFGAIRPSSTFAVEGGQAGIGAQGMNGMEDAPQMSQLRPGVRTSAFENRVSRVSFAADPRPSTESRRGRPFHTSTVPVPPLPDRQMSTESSSNSSPILSPVQTAGPLTLTPEDIRARMAGQETAPRPSIDEVMPALTSMSRIAFVPSLACADACSNSDAHRGARWCSRRPAHQDPAANSSEPDSPGTHDAQVADHGCYAYATDARERHVT